jgi:hypothetical protein
MLTLCEHCSTSSVRTCFGRSRKTARFYAKQLLHATPGPLIIVGSYSMTPNLAVYLLTLRVLRICVLCTGLQLLNVTKVTIGTHEMGPVAFSIVKVTT